MKENGNGHQMEMEMEIEIDIDSSLYSPPMVTIANMNPQILGPGMNGREIRMIQI